MGDFKMSFAYSKQSKSHGSCGLFALASNPLTLLSPTGWIPLDTFNNFAIVEVEVIIGNELKTSAHTVTVKMKWRQATPNAKRPWRFEFSVVVVLS